MKSMISVLVFPLVKSLLTSQQNLQNIHILAFMHNLAHEGRKVLNRIKFTEGRSVGYTP